MRSIGNPFSAAVLLTAAVAAMSATVTYQADGSNFANPERGFYHQNAIWPGESFNANSLRNWRTSENITVVRTYYRIDAFVNGPISQQMLTSIEQSFNACRTAGIKSIPRFSYNFGTDGTDAQLSRIQEHLEQLRPVLRAHADVIATMNAGFIGAWGEWHSSDFGLNTTSNMRIVLLKILDVLPTHRTVQLRYNYHKRAIFGNTPLNSDSGFCGSPRARTGAHNDCLGASVEDWGTYDPSGANDIEMQKNFLNLDNRYVPQEGETCNPSAYSTCDPVVGNLIRMRWDLLNIDYHGDVLQSWRDDGCFDNVQKSLGYRFRLIDATLPDRAPALSRVTGAIRLVNEGWGKAFNPRGCEIVLRNTQTNAVTAIATGWDPRRWLPEDGTISLALDVPLPASVTPGDYDLLLNLADTCAQLRTRPEYSIRLANQGVWEPSTGYNSLKHSIEVTSASTMLRAPDIRQGRADACAGMKFVDIRGRTIEGRNIVVPGVYALAGKGTLAALQIATR
jgi:hypothetical protein